MIGPTTNLTVSPHAIQHDRDPKFLITIERVVSLRVVDYKNGHLKR
jgi:hypothetical protein